MAEQCSKLLLDALSRAAAEPGGLPLHGGKNGVGLFPSARPGKLAAVRGVQGGYLRSLSLNTSGDGTARGLRERKKAPAELFVITEAGLSLLLQDANPRQVLEDLVRVLEARQVKAEELLRLAGRTQADILQLKATAERVLQQVPRTETLTTSFQMRPAVNGDRLHREPVSAGSSEKVRGPSAEQVAALHRAVVAQLDRWQASGAAEDLPLAELFRRVQAGLPGLTIGRFHDALRDLHEAERVYLHPWTGSLHDVPEPAFALLVGHLIAYYASARPRAEAAGEEPETATLLRFPAK